jgi:hypothetical protein
MRGGILGNRVKRVETFFDVLRTTQAHISRTTRGLSFVGPVDSRWVPARNADREIGRPIVPRKPRVKPRKAREDVSGGLDHGFGHTNPKRKRGNRRNSLPRKASLAFLEVALYVSANERFLGKDASSRSERPRNWHASTERFDWRSPIETEFSFRSVQLQNSCFGFLRWHRGGRIRDQGLNGSHTPSSIALRASLAAPFSPTVQRWKARTRRGEDR